MRFLAIKGPVFSHNRSKLRNCSRTLDRSGETHRACYCIWHMTLMLSAGTVHIPASSSAAA